MLEKTRAIVLHHIKFGESSLITHMFTERFGRKSFIMKGVRGRKTRMKANLVQPLFILNIEFYDKEKQELQLVKEFSLAENFSHFPYDVHKSAQAMFMAEVLYKSLRQEEPDQAMFDFLQNSFRYFDLQTEGAANFHLLFLIKLTRFLGILPLNDNSSDRSIFDIREGTFHEDMPFHFHFLERESARRLAKLLEMNYEEGSAVRFSHHERNALLDEILSFYSYHHFKLDNLNSLSVLKDLFH